MTYLATSSDVARLAGVSRATVSHVLNSTKYVSPDLVERVLDAVKKLNYRPHAIARSLAARRTYTVGVLVPQIGGTFYPAIIAAAEKVLATEGYSLILCDSKESEKTEAKNLGVIDEKRVDGLLWAPCSEKNVPFVRTIAESGTAISVVDRKLTHLEFDTVASNNFDAGKLASGYLLSKGYKRMAALTFLQRFAPSRDRLAGFRNSLHEVSIELSEDMICIAAPPETENARGKIARMLQSEKRPDAIFASSELLTLAALKEIRAAHLRIPEDIALLGFDDSPWSCYVDPPMSVITQDRQKMGTLAARLLLKAMKTKYLGEPELIELPVRLIERESC